MNNFILKLFLDRNRENLLGCRLVEAVSLYHHIFQIELRSLGSRFLTVSIHPEQDTLVIGDTPFQRAEAILGKSSPGQSRRAHAGKPDFEGVSFVKALNFQLKGGTLVGIEHSGFDNQVSLLFRVAGRFKNPRDWRLAIELMGRHSNAFLLTEESLVRSSAKRLTPAMNRYRRIITGRPFIPPPLHKRLSGEMSLNNLTEVLSEAPDSTVSKLLEDRFVGFSGPEGRRILSSFLKELPIQAGRPVTELAREEVGVLADKLTLLYEEDYARFLQPVIGQGSDLESYLFDSLTDFLRSKYVASRPGPGEKSGAVRIRGELEKVSRWPDIKSFAETLLERFRREPIASRIEREDEKSLLSSLIVEIQDRFPDMPAKIFRAETPSGVVMNLFAYAERLRRGEAELKRGFVESPKSELAAAPGLSREQEKRRRQVGSAPGLLRLGEKGVEDRSSVLQLLGRKMKSYQIPDGATIIVGLSDTANDEILRKHASPNDLWFHCRDYPGSHVVLKTGKREPSETLIKLAAEIAAYHSKGRKEKTVDVRYTEVKNLARPKGAKPGKVLVRKERVITVPPRDFALR